MKGLLALVAAGALALSALGSTPAAAAPTACGYQAAPRTQTVSIDPDMTAAGLTTADALAAFAAWNVLFEKYQGFDAFAPYYGDWQDADILITAHGWATTWVQTACQRAALPGNLKAIVFVGSVDAARNSIWLVHEIGHALGLPDFGTVAQMAQPGYSGGRVDPTYLGIMSYQTSPQSWLQDWTIAGFRTDADLVAHFYDGSWN